MRRTGPGCGHQRRRDVLRRDDTVGLERCHVGEVQDRYGLEPDRSGNQGAGRPQLVLPAEEDRPGPDETGDGEFWVGQTCFGIYEPTTFGLEFAPQTTAHLALHVDDMPAARAELEAKGIEFDGETFDTGVCYMAFFHDPDGNALMLHHRHTPRV